MKNLFAYGTLMCDDIMEDVAACRLPPPVPGTLKGYSRRSIKDVPYPALALDEKDRVEEMVYQNVPDSAWDRLDAFEGEMYERRLLQVELKDGKTLPVETYVVRLEFLDRLERAHWDLAGFLRNGKAGFQRDYNGYRSLES